MYFYSAPFPSAALLVKWFRLNYSDGEIVVEVIVTARYLFLEIIAETHVLLGCGLVFKLACVDVVPRQTTCLNFNQ